MEFFKVVTVAEAKEILFQNWSGQRKEAELVPLTQGLHRVLAENVVTQVDIPGFARSTVDGYAVLAKDTFGASEALPAISTISGEILMGQAPPGAIKPGEAMRIPTGGMLPENADAVVMVEYTEEMDDVTVLMERAVAPGENVVRRGEDISVGESLLSAGQVIRPQELGALAGVGVTDIPVVTKPKVAIISTGDEVVNPHETPGPGQVRDINSYALYGQVVALGGEATLYGIVPDQLETLRVTVEKALQTHDVVILSGGSSVGTRDVSAKVMDELGQPGVLVHGVSVRPGKPTIISVAQDKPIFGLPGHPVSAMVIFDLFVRPVIKTLLGEKQTAWRPVVQAKLSRHLASGGGREDYVRVMLEARADGLWAEPVLGKAGLITTMVKADGLVKIPLETEGLATGEMVQVEVF